MGQRAAGTIMIVDDTEDVRDLLRLQLTTLGYRVIEAANGREAIQRLKTERPELILMDLTMAAIGRIRSDQAHPPEP